MGKKKLNIDSITNELQNSAFFGSQSSPTSPEIEEDKPKVEDLIVNTEGKEKKHDNLDTNDDIVISRYQETTIERIRKIVKVIGKETTPLRLTPIEKEQLSDIVYSFKKKGIRTSENEINRIASNLLILDYKQNKDKSILTKVLEALNGWY